VTIVVATDIQPARVSGRKRDLYSNFMEKCFWTSMADVLLVWICSCLFHNMERSRTMIVKNIRKYKRELQARVKILQPGEKHKDFTVPVFVDLPDEWKVKPNTPLEHNEVRTAVCYADDVRRNFIEYYILKRVNWEQENVSVVSMVNQGAYTFYTDTVAIIPFDLISGKLRLELLRKESVLEIDRENKKRRLERKQKENQKIVDLTKELNGQSQNEKRDNRTIKVLLDMSETTNKTMAGQVLQSESRNDLSEQISNDTSNGKKDITEIDGKETHG
jgi:hypothetical protein